MDRLICINVYTDQKSQAVPKNITRECSRILNEAQLGHAAEYKFKLLLESLCQSNSITRGFKLWTGLE